MSFKRIFVYRYNLIKMFLGCIRKMTFSKPSNNKTGVVVYFLSQLLIRARNSFCRKSNYTLWFYLIQQADKIHIFYFKKCFIFFFYLTSRIQLFNKSSKPMIRFW